MAGVDGADAATAKAEGNIQGDYTQFLDANALNGARIGIARDFMEADEEGDWMIEASLEARRGAGAEVIDVELPEWLMESRGKFYRAIRYREFRAQIADYLATIGDEYPKTLDEVIKQSMTLTSRREDGAHPNPGRWELMLDEVESGELTDYEYIAVRDHALPLIRGIIGGILESENLDAIVYPTSPTRPWRARATSAPAANARVAPREARATTNPPARNTPPAPVLPPRAAIVRHSRVLMMASARSSIALMFRHDSSAGLSLASMRFRGIPFDQKSRPPASTMTFGPLLRQST